MKAVATIVIGVVITLDLRPGLALVHRFPRMLMCPMDFLDAWRAGVCDRHSASAGSMWEPSAEQGRQTAVA